ncbi:MAG: sulfatase [Candidatus Glassbacteria bacterium]|nr:sulfatase [Candidatus Glassbacteria bacterium]
MLKTVLPLLVLGPACRAGNKKVRPNILLLMSDNHSWNHLGCYGDRVVQTPNIDRIAAQGVKFSHAFCAAPSCSPARAGMLSGQDIWRLEEGANLWGILPDMFPFYTDLLEASGYHVGSQGKGWGPGSVAESGREYNHGGRTYNSFGEFLEKNLSDQPWCYWFSSQNPHRPYELGSGERSGMDPAEVEVPSYLPDNDAVRGDICDYYFEIQKFDAEVGEILRTLDASGQREKTLIVICSDNGWQMPRGLANLYDFGTRIPLIFSWQRQIQEGRTVDDLINLNDLAPTFLEIAGVPVPAEMTARSLTNLLFSSRSGRIDPARNRVFTARERHALCRMNGLGYPGRAIRTRDFLYIRNYEPERWPGGDPPLFGDCDAHMLHYPAPTKIHLLAHRDEPEIKPLFDLAFAKRPEEELYDLRSDPDQMNNLAESADCQAQREELSNALNEYLSATDDPRISGKELKWEQGKYYETADFKPRPSREAIELLDLEEEYNYFPE